MSQTAARQESRHRGQLAVAPERTTGLGHGRPLRQVTGNQYGRPARGHRPRRPRIFGEASIATASPMIKPLARAVIAALHRRVSIQIRLIWAN